MSILDLKSVPQDVLRRLKKAGWTLETLAAATVFDLENIKGIGKTRARQLIDEAQATLKPVVIVLTGPVEGEVPITVTDSEGNAQEEEVPMSVKVKRIRDANQ